VGLYGYDLRAVHASFTKIVILQSGLSKMRRCETLASFILFCAIGAADAQEIKSTSTGVFTEEQARRGAVAYNANCASCHGAELRSTDREIPNLSDKSFKFSWVGKTIAEKFEIVRNTMPPKEERSLEDQVYLDIVAYILQFNKIPSGHQSLKPDLQILTQIVISAPAD
jgi:mono/diheme cytochrome c family protein